MSGHICKPYRGHGIHIEIAETRFVSFNGSQRRYVVTWCICKESLYRPDDIVATYAEARNFVCPEEAIGYAERRAQTFVDCSFYSIASYP
jgi:hypothetical protein